MTAVEKWPGRCQAVSAVSMLLQFFMEKNAMSSIWKCLLALMLTCNVLTMTGCGKKTTVVEGKEEEAAEKFPSKAPDKGDGAPAEEK